MQKYLILLFIPVGAFNIRFYDEYDSLEMWIFIALSSGK